MKEPSRRLRSSVRVHLHNLRTFNLDPSFTTLKGDTIARQVNYGSDDTSDCRHLITFFDTLDECLVLLLLFPLLVVQA